MGETMNRLQRKLMSNHARRTGGSGNKPITRKQARAWLAPMRNAINTMKSGEVESIRCYAVTRLHWNDRWERVDWCCAGFRCLINRLTPSLDTTPIRKVENKLANGVPLTVQELDDVNALLNRIEDTLLSYPYDKVKDAVLTEQINIEIEQLGLKEAA
jgi:hypothetical protein